ncbi:MAG: L,D-transpeptidase family protein [Thermoanaerobaculia bacterium]
MTSPRATSTSDAPAFELEAFDGGRPVLEMPIVVGRTDWMTPLFRDEMAVVEINPYWNVPPSIAAAEVLPEAREDLDAFLARGYEVLSGRGEDASVLDPRTVRWNDLDPENLDLRFRQVPGPTNALGNIKFLFPNQYNVYLHDTPADRAFAETERALSHGCVRVSRPLDLAAWVFAHEDGWDRARVEEVIDSGVHTAVALDEPIPVYILYWTAYVEDGEPQFRDDIYGIDAALEESLETRTAAGRQRVAG